MTTARKAEAKLVRRLLLGLPVACAMWVCACSGDGRNGELGDGSTVESDPSDDGGQSADSELGACVPKTCEGVGASCGVIENGCGTLLDCGSCEAPETCGGAGVDGQCGCRPLTCEWMGANCGTMEDGCGGTVSCGACREPDICGGSGVPNRCGQPICPYAWCYENPRPQADDMFTVFRDTAGRVWTGGAIGALLCRTGSSWQLVDTYTRVPSDLLGLWIDPSGLSWAVGQNGAILFYEEQYQRFHCKTPENKYWSPVKWDIRGIFAAAPDDAWAVGDNGYLHFDGAAWKAAGTSGGPLYAVLGRTADDIWAVGEAAASQAQLLVTHWDGERWRSVPVAGALGAGESGRLRALTIDAAGVVFAAGELLDEAGQPAAGLLLRGDAGHFVRVPLPVVPPLRGVAVDRHERVWAAGLGGALVVVEKESTRQVPPVLGRADIHGLAGTGGNTLLLVGAHGQFAELSRDLWRTEATALPFQDGETAATAFELRRNDVWFGGRGWILNWNGTMFGATGVAADITGLLALAPDRVFAAANRTGEGGGVLLAYDGQTWSEVLYAPEERFAGIGGSSTTDLRIRLATDQVLHVNRQDDPIVPVVRSREAFPASSPGVKAPPSDWQLDPESGFSHAGLPTGAGTRIWPFEGLQKMPRGAIAFGEEILVAGDDGVIRYDGATWSKLTRVPMRAIAGRSPDSVWFVGSAATGGPLWHFDGKTLSAFPSAGISEGELSAVAVSPAGTVFAAGRSIYRGTADGFLELGQGNGEPCNAAWATADEAVWVGCGFDLLRFDGGGWSSTPVLDLLENAPMAEDTRVSLTGAYSPDDTEVFLVGNTADRQSAVVLVWDGSAFGSSERAALEGEATITSVWGTSSDDIYISMGQLGYVFHYIHSWRTFDDVFATTAEPLGALTATGSGTIIGIGPFGTILRY